MNIRQKILTGVILFGLILTLILAYNNCQRFTAIITRHYENDALRTAQTALNFIDADNFSAYIQDSPEVQKVLQERQKITDTQNAIFIYTIEPFNNYNDIRFYVNVKNSNYAIVIRDNGISVTGDHITALVPIKNNGGAVQSILCVQMQMDELDAESFVTAFCGVLNLTTGKFIYVDAGHNPPLIRRRGKNFEELPMELNFVLGGWKDWQYIQQEIQLESGDTIFLYTDGVTEAANSAGQMYSLERLKDFLNGQKNNLAAEKILREVQISL